MRATETRGHSMEEFALASFPGPPVKEYRRNSHSLDAAGEST
jgi:hypothetical protein